MYNTQNQYGATDGFAFATPINTNDVEAFDASPIPAGIYETIIENEELKTTKAGTGQYVSLMFRLVTPPHDGRVVWGNYNVVNPNPVAVEIAMRDLGTIAKYCGIEMLSNTAQLLFQRIKVKVAIKDGRNEIKGYSKSEIANAEEAKKDKLAGMTQTAPQTAPQPIAQATPNVAPNPTPYPVPNPIPQQVNATPQPMPQTPEATPQATPTLAPQPMPQTPPATPQATPEVAQQTPPYPVPSATPQLTPQTPPAFGGVQETDNIPF